MGVGVRFPRAIERDRGIAIESVLGRIERRMLSGEDQRRLKPALSQRVREWG
jgi:hypothetical protein